MSIELDAVVLSNEIRIAEDRTRKQLEPLRDIQNQYVGGYFGGRTAEAYIRENHWHEWIATNLPLYYMNAPRVKTTSRVRGPMRVRAEAVARGIGEGVNETIERTDFDAEAFYCAHDFAFCHAVMLVTLESYVLNVPMPPDVMHGGPWSMPVPTMRPRAERILPNRFIFDPLTVVVNKARWMGHISEYDPDDLRKKGKQDGWDQAMIEAAIRDVEADLPEREENEMPERAEIIAYDIWIRGVQPDPELGPDQGYHGAICTVGKDDEGTGAGVFLRRPVPYKGPPCGPYVVGGAYGVTDSPWFLSPLVSDAPQVDELNTQAEVIADGMANYKRGIAVDSAQQDLAEKWTENKDSTVLAIAGLAENKNAIQQIETGGVTPQMYQAHIFLHERLQRKSGQSQNKSGRITDSTASEASIVQANTNVRSEFLSKRFTKFIRQVVWVMAWQFFHNELIYFTPVGSEEEPFIDETTGMPMEAPVMVGGAMGDDGFSFEDIKLSIEPYSMERVDQNMLQQNWMAMADFVLKTVPIMRQFPEVDWKRLYEKGGDVLNDPEFGDIIKFEMMQLMTGLMMGAPLSSSQGAPQTQSQPAPSRQGQQPGPQQGAMVRQSRVPQAAQNGGMR